MNMRVITAVLTVFTTLLLSWNTAEADRLVTYYHNDILGSPVAATDEAGELLWRETYRPYGEKIEDRDGNNRIGYTGHVFDQETGLTYMRARYYDPVIGRFMSTDPVGYTEANPVMSFNRYAYVNNNPYKYNDPDGEFLNFAIKFVADVALGTTLNYLESGELKLGAAVTDAAIGVVNPAKTLQKARRIANLVKRSCCFVAGTQVLTESGYKNIEDVQPGEKLWAKNIESGKQDWKPVTRIFVEPDRGIYAVKLVGAEGFEQSIEATDDHPFYVAGTGWKTTLELLAGDQIETDGYGAMAVASVVDQQRSDLTYNFAVADFHTYYVTERNILVHNCGGNAAKGGKPGSYRPDRALPRDKHGNPIPDSDAPHTQLGTKRGRNGDYTQAREFDANGKPVRDIDFTDHGRPQNHPNPHQHRYVPNETGGTPRRLKDAEPL